MRKRTERWIPKDTLTKQGYFEGARYIWIPKNNQCQEVPKPQGTSLHKRPAKPQTKLKWIPKRQKAEHTTNTQTEVHRKEYKPAKLQKKATAIEKGKWVPKVACKSTEHYLEQLPGTSNHTNTNMLAETMTIQRPISSTNPLDVVKQLVFILRTFNSKQVDAKWRQFMVAKATGKVTSSTEALGPNLLQDPPLARH